MTELTPSMALVLATLADGLEPLTGRRVAGLTGMAPGTAIKLLNALLDLGAVDSTDQGRSTLWHVTPSAEPLLRGDGADRPERCAIILTARPGEYAEVRGRLPDGSEIREPGTGIRYHAAALSAHQLRWKVNVFEIGMGNTTAAALTALAVDRFEADVVMFVGVGAGVKPKQQRPGDVLVVSSAYNGHAGKYHQTDAGVSVFQSRPVSRPANSALVQLAKSVQHRPAGSWTFTRPRHMNVSVGPIASTEAVVADNASDIYQRIITTLGDAEGIDMESYGVFESAATFGVPAIAVRGLSDFVQEKGIESDKKWQPIAARHAAAVALEMLMSAHPGDVPPRKLIPPGPVCSPDPAPRPLAVPPHARRWLDRLRKVAPKRAEAAESAITDNDARRVRSWISTCLNNPPAWLRGDVTGDGWALVASIADGVGAGTALRAWQRAAQVAADTGDPALGSVFSLWVAVSIRIAGDGQATADAVAQALTEVDLAAYPQLESLRHFYLATTTSDNTAIRVTAGSALMAMRGSDAKLDVVALTGTSEPDADDVPVTPLDSSIRSWLTVSVLATLSYVWLVDEQGERAQRCAEAALVLAPFSTTARLRRGQALMVRVNSNKRGSGLGDISVLLSNIERDALAVRRGQAEYGGSTVEALALAGKARVESGDPAGALRLLLPAPRGQATEIEAAADDVLQPATIAALLTGDNELALELANRIGSSVESQFLRAAAFARASNMRDNSVSAYRAALDLAGDNTHNIRRALLGLARLKVPMAGPDITEHVQRLRTVDEQAADLVMATSALSTGDYDRAIELARRHRTELDAVMLEAEGLTGAGRPEEAVELLDEFGREVGDIALRGQAMMLAGRAGLYDTVAVIADAIISSSEGELLRMAREARAEGAARTGDWDVVDAQNRLLLDELDVTVSEYHERAVRYRWVRAEALYRRRRFTDALDVLSTPTQVPVANRSQVLLVLAIMRSLAPQDVRDDMFDWILTIAASWIKDEQIGAEAVKLIVLLPVDVTDVRLMRARELMADYFSTHGSDAQIKQIDLGDNPNDPDITSLIEFLRTQFEPRTEQLAELATKLWLGRLPAGFLADVRHRAYSEVLIKQELGCYVVRPALTPAAASVREARRSDARASLGGTVVIDTSALVIGCHLGLPRQHLLAKFARVTYPISLRDDVYAGQASLAMRSNGSMGWDADAHRPVITNYPADLVEQWVKSADELASDLARLTIQPDAEDPDQHLWSAALRMARNLGLPLWADDNALATVAAHEGLATFSTLDLLEALEADDSIDVSGPDLLDQLSRDAGIVDLPLPADWATQARHDRFDPAAYLRLAISRPSAWIDHAASFGQYQRLIRTMLESPPVSRADDDAGKADEAELAAVRITAWAGAAANGIAWASPPPARCQVVGALLAWTALNAEPLLDSNAVLATSAGAPTAPDDAGPGPTPRPGAVLGELLMIALAVQRGAFPAGDGVGSVIRTLADALRTVASGAQTAALIARAVETLNENLRTAAMTAFLASPPGAIFPLD